MSTTKQLKVYKGLPTIIKSRARGYYDNKTVLTFDTDAESQNITMDVYDGLRYTTISGNNASVIDFSGTILPYKWDYEDKLKDLKYYFLPITGGQTITKYELNGGEIGVLSFDEDTGLVSNFSTSNYIQLRDAFNPANDSWEAQVKFTTSSDVTTNQQILHSRMGTGNSGRFGIGLSFENTHFNFYCSSDGSSWLFDLYGTYTILTNTTYWLKIGWDGVEYYLEYSLDGETYTRDITNASTSAVYSPLMSSFIGVVNTGSFTNAFGGSIDLSQTHIKIDDEIWWEGTTVVTKHNQYTITNTLEVNLNNLSNCPSSILDENNFTIIDGKLASGPKSYNVNNGYSYGYIEYTPTETLTITIKAYVSSEGGYDYGACYIGTQIYEATRSQITNGTTDENGEWIFKISGSTNETSYTKELIGGTTYYIQFYYTKDGSANSGSDRLFITALENFNNFTVTKTETLPGCSADYTDDGSAVTLNCFAIGDEKVILTPNNNYTNGTYLGTVNIPQHSV